MQQSEWGLTDYERRERDQRRRTRNNLAVIIGLVLVLSILEKITQ